MGAGHLVLFGVLGFLPAAGQEPPPGPEPVPLPLPAPAPVPVGTPVAVTAIPNGYQIVLSRGAAELLRDALDRVDEKAVAGAIRDEARRRKGDAAEPDPDTAAKLELVALLVSTQVPAFKKALAGRVGPHGAVVKVTGLQAPAIKFAQPRPRLERALGVVRSVMPLLPDDARDALEAMRAVGRTTPLAWEVEPR